jgi:2-hydroxy-3-keto-5-methylthiopentenyl-1-phosphate phosphatase
MPQIRIFLDFDGTVTERDVGNSVFERFLDPRLLAEGFHHRIIGEWKAGRMSSRECLTLECRNSVAPVDRLDELLESHTLTAGFVEFAGFCRKNEIPVTILSDGLDYYIGYLLRKFGLDWIPYRANALLFDGDAIEVSFPYEGGGCGRCGNCKRRHIESERRDGERIVYVGDGYSDRYAIRSADIVFARDDLACVCSDEGIAYNPFSDFHEVIRRLGEYLYPAAPGNGDSAE